MTKELKKQGGVDDAAAAGLVEETAAASTELDDACLLYTSDAADD